MRTLTLPAILLLCLLNAAIANDNEFYYFVKLDRDAKIQDNNHFVRAELNVEGNAFVFLPSRWAMHDYLQDTNFSQESRNNCFLSGNWVR